LGYEAEIEFLLAHKEKYGNVPDKETFLEKFPNFEIIEVNESPKYLVDTIREEHLYTVSVPVVQKFAELLKSDANEAAEYLKSQTALLQPNYSISGIDISKQSDIRYKEYLDRKQNQKHWYLESGFPELDNLIGGIQTKEELVIVAARLGQGKSFFTLKMGGHLFQCGLNVGYISPEMSYNAVGFRFDTLLGHFSNRKLMHGEEEAEYQKHIEELKKKENKFIVATPADFGREITVSKIRNFVKQYKLDAVFIDGIKYLRDERGRKNDNLTTSLTNISEDLIEMSVELEIPVFAVVQANRQGASSADEDGAPSVEHIRDSDGIGHCATKVFTLKQKTDGVLEVDVVKNRYGESGGRVNYLWDKDVGTYTYIPTTEKPKSRRAESNNNGHKDTKEVF
jgi:replicative DNA helicase